MKVSLVIPIYNEAAHLMEFLRRIDQLQLPVAKELIFIDDHSSDGSKAVLERFQFTSEHKLLFQPFNQGKGAAIKRGFENATGDFIGVQDADFEYDMDDIAALILPLMEGRADAVYGSRFKKSGEQVHRTFHYLVNRFLTLLSNLCTGMYLTDMETCYKFFRRDLIKSIELESRRFGFEPEVTAKIAHLKLRVLEIPIRYYPRNYQQGKKISWKDGVAAVRHIFYFSFFANPKKYLKPSLPQSYVPTEGNWL